MRPMLTVAGDRPSNSMPAAACRRRRVSGPKRSASHRASSAAASAVAAVEGGARRRSGASSAIVDSWRHSSACSRCSAQFRRRPARAPRKRRYCTSSIAREQRVELPKCASSTAAVLAPMPGTPGMLSTASPRQREVIGDLVRMHAVARLDARRAPALAARVIPLLVEFAEQLRQVLVGRHDHAADARARARRAARCRSGRRLRIRGARAPPGRAPRTAPCNGANWRRSSSGAGSRLAL